MKAFYIETSALLAPLLEESGRSKFVAYLDQADTVTASALTILEAERSLVRAEVKKTIKTGVRQKLQGILSQLVREWVMMEITPAVIARAAEPFPIEPVRSLDAIHLATILEFLKSFPDLRILSRDQRIIANLEPLGLSAV